MKSKDFNHFFDAISQPRISSYRYFFGTHLSNNQLYGCYLWNEAVSLTFFRVLTLVEIILRNRMHSVLSRHYYHVQKEVVTNSKSRHWIFQETNTTGEPDSCNWYETQLLSPRSLAEIHKKTHHYRRKTPLNTHSPNDVVSSLTLGFWSSLIDKCPQIDWPTILGDIFPKHRATASSQWHHNNQVKRLNYRLQFIRDFRNRIAHHEPIWKFAHWLDEKPASANQLREILFDPPDSPADSIKRLRMAYQRITELLRWLSQDIYNDLIDSQIHQQLLWLCSDEGLQTYQASDDKVITMNASKFKRELRKILKTQQVTHLNYKGRAHLATHPIN